MLCIKPVIQIYELCRIDNNGTVSYIITQQDGPIRGAYASESERHNEFDQHRREIGTAVTHYGETGLHMAQCVVLEL